MLITIGQNKLAIQCQQIVTTFNMERVAADQCDLAEIDDILYLSQTVTEVLATKPGTSGASRPVEIVKKVHCIVLC